MCGLFFAIQAFEPIRELALRALCITFIAITFYGSLATAGPELTRRGLLLGMGATAVALKLPKPVQAAQRIEDPFWSQLHSGGTTYRPGLMVIDEFMNNLGDGNAYWKKMIKDGRVVMLGDFKLDVDLSSPHRIQPLGITDHLGRFANGIARIVKRETFDAIQNLISQPMEQQMLTAQKLIEKMEPEVSLPCETLTTKPEALLVIEDNK